MGRTWTNSPERTYPSTEYAAAWIACIAWMAEWHRRKAAGIYFEGTETMEEICTAAAERAKRARIEVAELPEEGDGLDRHGLQELQDSEGVQPFRALDRRLAGNMAASIHPVRHAQEAEREIDRLISELESGEGAGE